jgi:NifU-like protein involved in Fe-S cluster formation
MEGEEGLSALARDHLENPRGQGRFPAQTPNIAVGEAGSVASGAFVRLSLRMVEGRIGEARFEVLGPPALIAIASWFVERLKGRKAAPAVVPTGMEAARALDLPRAAHGFALLAEDAALACLKGIGETA